MKLHLPSSLRKALLACIAAFPALLPSTLASGAAILLGTSCSFALASEPADDEVDEDEDENEFPYALISGDEYSIAPYAATGFQGPDVDWSAAQQDDTINSGADFTLNITDDQSITAVSVNGVRGYKYTFSGGHENLDIRFNKTAAGGPAVLVGELTARNLFLTGSTTEGASNYYRISTDDNVTNPLSLSNINGTIYIQQAGLQIRVENTDLSANFSVGSAVRAGSGSSSVLQINANVTTSGHLEIQENTSIDIQGATFTVSELRGNGDLTLNTSIASVSGAAAGALTLINGGSSYGGKLTFGGSASAVLSVNIGTEADATLTATGLAGSYSNIVAGSGHNATLRITGSDSSANSVSNITIFDRVTLELAGNAYQALTNFTFGSGASLTLGANSTLALSGGVLDLSGGTLSITTSGAIALNVTNTTLKLGQSNFTNDLLSKLTLSLEGMELGQTYNLFNIEGLSLNGLTEWQDILEGMVAGNSGADDYGFIFNISGNYITIAYNLQIQDGLVWASGSGTWGEGLEGQWGSAYPNRPTVGNVTFGTNGASVENDNAITIADTGVNAMTMDILGGKWTFSGGSLTAAGAMTIGKESQAIVTFSNGSISAKGLTVSNGSSVTVSASGDKSFGAVTLAEGTTFTITDANNWSNTTITGDGTLVFSGLDLSASDSALVESLLKNILTTYNSGNPNKLGALRLSNGSNMLLGNDKDLRNWIQNITEIYVDDGASIGVNSPSMNITSDPKPTLHLQGKGVSNSDGSFKGALYTPAGTNRTITWGIVLDADATIRTDQNNNVGRAEFAGAFDLDNHTLTKIGTGGIVFRNNTFGTPNSTGTIDIQGGYLEVVFGGNNKATAIAGFTILLSNDNTELKLDDDYTIHSLAGSGSVGAYASLASTEETAHTLTIRNSMTSATTMNTFTGSMSSYVTIVMAGGYWALGDGISLSTVNITDGTVDFGANNRVTELNMTGGKALLGDGIVVNTLILDGSNANAIFDGTQSDTSTIHAISGGDNGGGTLTVSSGSLLVSYDVADNVKAHISSGGTLQLYANASSAWQSITLERGGTLDLLFGTSFNAAEKLTIAGDDGTAIIKIDVSYSETALAPVLMLGNTIENLRIILDIDVSGLLNEDTTTLSLVDYIQYSGSDLVEYLDYSSIGRAWRAEWDSATSTITLTKGEDAQLDLVWKGGDTWSYGNEEWSNSEEPGSDERFALGDNAIFNTADHTGDEAIIVAGTGITAGNVSIQSGSWTFEGGQLTVNGEFTIEGGGTITFNNTLIGNGTGMTIGDDTNGTGDGTKLVLTDRVGDRNLGAVEVKKGSVFVFDPVAGAPGVEGSRALTNWSETDYVHGGGTLLLGSTGSTADYYDASAILNFVQAGHSLQRMQIGEGDASSGITVRFEATASVSEEMIARLREVKELYITDGSALNLDNNTNAFAYGDDAPAQRNLLILAGTGNSTDQSISSALNLSNGNTRIDWDVRLVGDTTICAYSGNAALVLTINGSFDFAGHTLANSGRGCIVLAGGVSNVGDIKLTNQNFGGRLRFTSTAAGGQVAKVIYTGVAASQLQLEGAANGLSYTVESVNGAGTVQRQGTTGTAELVISNTLDAAEDANTFSGTIGSDVTVKVTGGYWKFTGTQTGSLAIAGGTLELAAASESTYSLSSMSGGTLKVGANATANFGTAAAGATLTALALDGGSVALSDGTLNIGTLDISGAGASGSIEISLTGAAKLNVDALGSNLTGGSDKITIKVSALEALNLLDTGYELFEGTLLSSAAGWGSNNFEVELTGEAEGLDLTASVDDNGYLSFNLHAADLTWKTAGGGTWQLGGDSSWEDDSGSEQAFSAYAIVTFDNAAGGAMQLTGDIIVTKLTVASGDWTYADAADAAEGTSLTTLGGIDVQNGSATFNNSALEVNGAVLGTVTFASAQTTLNGQVTIGSASRVTQVTFSGSGAIATAADGGSLHVNADSTVTVSTTGSKAFGAITVDAGGEFIISDATDTTWGANTADNGANLVSGNGALVYKDLGTVSGDSSKSLIYNTLKNGSQLAALRLRDNTNLMLDAEFGTANDGSNSFGSLAALYVEDGAALGIASGSTNGGSTHLYLSGTGVDGSGALHITNDSRTMTWNITLTGNTTIKMTNNGVNTYIVYEGTLDLGGRKDDPSATAYTLTKSGNGSWVIKNNASSVANSYGTIDVAEGLMEIRLDADHANTFADYDVKLSGATAVLGHSAGANVKINALAGVAGSTLRSYNGSGSTSTTARTLTISNNKSSADTANTFSGTVMQGITLVLAGGYEKLDGTLQTGTHYTVAGTEAQPATLELAGSFKGAHTLTVGDYGTLDLTAASRETAARLTILATASSTQGKIKGLNLASGDVLSITGTAEAGTNDPVTALLLTGGTTLNGGSTLKFGVRNTAADNQAAQWVTSTSFTVEGGLTLAATADNKLHIELDPYGRRATGELITWGAGTKHLLISGGDWTDDKVALLDTEELVGRLKYKLLADAGDLYIQVIEAAGELTWNVAEGGNWSATNAWLMEGTEATFLNGDAVMFDTLADAADTVDITIDAAGVQVGAITVQGNTSYTIGGGAISGGADLVVGTEDTPFTGTLTLTSANAWTGNNTLNSGTVALTHAEALSNTETTVKNGATLELALNNATLASALTLEDGAALTARSSSTANATVGAAKLQAANGATLTLQTAANLGKITVNSDADMTGKVQLAASADVTAAELNVRHGQLALSAPGNDVVYTASSVKLAAAGEITVAQGATLKGKMEASSVLGNIALEAGSALQTVGSDNALVRITSAGATLTSEDYTKVSDRLTLSSGNSTLQGEWDIAAVDGAGVLTVDRAADVTLRAGSVSEVTAHGDLNVADGVKISALSMDAGTLSGADSNTAALALQQMHLNGTAQVSNTLSITLQEAGSEISGAGVSVAADLTVNHASPSADTPELTISNGAAVSGAIIIESGRVVIDNAAVTGHIDLNGAAATLDLSNTAAGMGISMTGGGTLQGAGAYTGTLVLDDADMKPGVVFELGGLSDAAKVTLVRLHGGNTVEGLTSLHLTGNSTLYLTPDQQVSSELLPAPIFNFTGDGTLTLDDGATLLLNVTDILSDVVAAGGAGLSYRISNMSVESWQDKVSLDATAVVLGWEVSISAQGQLHLTYAGSSERKKYQSTEQQGSSNNWAEAEDGRDIYESTGSWGAIVVDKETNIDLRGKKPTGIYEQTGLLLHNLMGTQSGDLNIRGDGTSKVTFQNDVSDDELGDFLQEMGMASGSVFNSLSYAGNINIDKADMEVKHVDALYSTRPGINSTTSISGNLKLTGGNLTMTSGRLELGGDDNVLERDVTFNAYQGQVSISGYVKVGGYISMQENADAVGEERAHVQLKGGELALSGGAGVGAGVIIGSDAVSNTLQLAGTLSVGEDWLSSPTTISAASKLRHVLLEVNGDLRIDTATGFAMRAAVEPEAEWVLAGISGTGTVATNGDSGTGKDITFIVSGEDRYFSGDLSNYSGVMIFAASPYTQHFNGVTGGSGWDLINTEGGRVSFDLMAGGKSNTLTMGELTLEAGSFTTILLDMENLNAWNGLHLSKLTIENKADVTIGQYKGVVWLDGEDGDRTVFALGSIEAKEKNIGSDVQWHLRGIRNAKDFTVCQDADGTLYASVTQDNTNLYARYADNANSAAGATLLWGKNTGDTVVAVDEVVYNLLGAEGAPKSQADVAEANRVLAAVAGASTAVLGQAFSADLERQLRNVRNRTTTLQPNGDTPQSGTPTNVWLQAENNYHKQKAEGLLPGFRTTGWGGSVGMDIAAGKSSAFGLALSAMYNDVTAHGPDSLKADMDTYYLSAYAQVSDGAWRHTFLATVGTADISTTRTVNYGPGSYTVNGDTESRGFGLMYELGYSAALDREGDFCLQAVFNAAWRMSNVKDYTESGNDAALRVQGSNRNDVTLGLGARMQAAVGGNIWNSVGILETRALLKTELGDRYGEAQVSFQGAGRSAKVRSSERGVLGIELGAGLTLPVTTSSSVFADFSVELWKNLVEMNAGIGLRVSF